MYDTTVPRPDVTSEQVADTLRRALGSRFHVLPDTAINQRPKAALGPIMPTRSSSGPALTGTSALKSRSPGPPTERSCMSHRAGYPVPGLAA